MPPPNPPCPCCSSTALIPIVHGYPTPHAQAEAARGELILAGCVVDRHSARWCCRRCGLRFHEDGAVPEQIAFRAIREIEERAGRILADFETTALLAILRDRGILFEADWSEILSYHVEALIEPGHGFRPRGREDARAIALAREQTGIQLPVRLALCLGRLSRPLQPEFWTKVASCYRMQFLFANSFELLMAEARAETTSNRERARSSFRETAGAVEAALGLVGHAIERGARSLFGRPARWLATGVDAVQSRLSVLNQWMFDVLGSAAGRTGNVILGALAGLAEGVGDLVTRVLSSLRMLGEAIAALLRLDVGGALGRLAEVGLESADLVIAILRVATLGTVAGGIAAAWRAEDLRRFAAALVNERFQSDEAHRRAARRHLGLTTHDFRLPLDAVHRTFVLDSALVPLRVLHRQGQIDLFELAGVRGARHFSVKRRHTQVRVAHRNGLSESPWPAGRRDIAAYLEGAPVRLHVYALSEEAVRDRMTTARRKARTLGIDLRWHRQAQTHVATSQEINQSWERHDWLAHLMDAAYPRRTLDAQRELSAFASVAFLPCLGHASARYARTDGTMTIRPPRGVPHPIGAGIAYRDAWPEKLFRYVLAHEVGRYVGLRHEGHRGFQNIMFNPGGTPYRSWGLFRFWLGDEPEFSFEDGKTAWRFLVREMPFLLTEAAAEPAGPSR